MLPLSVAGKNQMAGWLAGRSDGDNYGKLVAFRFPKGRFVDGPAQVESRINSDSRFSADLTLWDQHGSHVIRGNLLILPLANGQLVAIEPIYIEAEQTGIPTLARVVFAQLMPDDRKIEWADSLSAAEDLVVGGAAPQPQPGQPAPAAGPQSRSADPGPRRLPRDAAGLRRRRLRSLRPAYAATGADTVLALTASRERTGRRSAFGCDASDRVRS